MLLTGSSGAMALAQCDYPVFDQTLRAQRASVQHTYPMGIRTGQEAHGDRVVRLSNVWFIGHRVRLFFVGELRSVAAARGWQKGMTTVQLDTACALLVGLLSGVDTSQGRQRCSGATEHCAYPTHG